MLLLGIFIAVVEILSFCLDLHRPKMLVFLSLPFCNDGIEYFSFCFYFNSGMLVVVNAT